VKQNNATSKLKSMSYRHSATCGVFLNTIRKYCILEMWQNGLSMQMSGELIVQNVTSMTGKALDIDIKGTIWPRFWKF